MTEVELKIADYIISHHIDLLRVEAGVRNEALALLNKLGRELESVLRARDFTKYTQPQVKSMLAEITKVIDAYYTEIQKPINAAMVGIADVQAHIVQNAVNSAFIVNIEANLPAVAYLKNVIGQTLIQGAALKDWFKRQSAETAFRFGNMVRQGMVNGETNAQILKSVLGTPTQPGLAVMDVSKRNLQTLIHTTIQTVANKARLETIRANPAVNKGIRQMSTLDSHTSLICIAYSGAEWDLDGNPINETVLPFNGGPPRHFNCRSILTPIPKTYRELGYDIDEPDVGTRASMDGPVRGDMTMAQFLKRQGKDFENASLGEGRAQLWRDKKITLQQLLDQRGNPLSMTQLLRKFK